MKNKILAFVYRRVKSNYQKIRYIRKSLNELKSKYNKNKTNIWFLGSADYNNIGDLAISEATVNFIKKNFPTYNLIEIRLSDYYKYYVAIKSIINKNDIIVIQGGGNMGYAYFGAEKNRREIIKSFKENKIIVFPSTIDYGKSDREQKELRKSIQIYNSHKNLYLCAREEKSYNIMNKIYKNVILVPDIVLSLNYKNIRSKSNDIIICLRNDNEKTEESLKLRDFFDRMDNNYIFTDNIADKNDILLEDRKKIFEDKLRFFAHSKIVFTDRLHVMIFCVITNTPCLFIDNKNGKINGVYKKWIEKKIDNIQPLNVSDNIEKQIEELLSKKTCDFYNFDNEFEELVLLFKENS